MTAAAVVIERVGKLNRRVAKIDYLLATAISLALGCE